MRAFLYVVGSLFLISNCSSIAQIETTPNACDDPRSPQFASSGKIEIDHGDYLVDDGGVRLFLIRDEQYLEWVDYLDGKHVQLLLTPISACDAASGSSMVACIYLGNNGTAHLIAEWCKVE